MKKPQKTKNTSKKKGTKALSGATVKATSTPANHQAEIAHNDGTLIPNQQRFLHRLSSMHSNHSNPEKSLSAFVFTDDIHE